jgi:hypothetical protein
LGDLRLTTLSGALLADSDTQATQAAHYLTMFEKKEH